MSARAPRFEVCQSDAGWFARFRAANGRIIWVTETYQRRRVADRAIDAIRYADPLIAPVDVDERTEATS